MPQGVATPPSAAQRIIMALQALAHPLWLDQTPGSSAALRVVIPAVGTTGVGLNANIAQVGGVDGKTAVADIAMRNNWSNSVRSRIT